LQAGVNLPHPSRFFITTFLSSLNQKSESVMQLFATAPDFKESFTRYQVEHITGTTSSTKYSAPKCDTLVSSGVCPGPNALCRQIRHPLSYYRVMAESEKEVKTRLERILLAVLNREEYPTKLLENNMQKFGDFDFSYDKEIVKRKLSEAIRADTMSKVQVKINHFQGRVYSVEVPKEERKIWITKAALSITDGNSDYDCLPLTDWKLALPIGDAQYKSKSMDLVVKPFEINLGDNEVRKLFMILGIVEES
jgi:hypothetical protein